MIQAAILKNFQRHKLLKLDFSPSVTAIVGSNDLGKSSIRRALSWVLLDYPRGKDIINRDADEAGVYLKLPDKLVSRIRSKSGDTNTWKCGDLEFIRPGTIPEQITNITENSIVELDQTSINLCFTRQNDGYFLIDQGPTFRARLIDDLTGVFVAEKAIRLGKSEIKEITNQKEIISETIQTAQQEADSRTRFIILAKKAEALGSEIAKVEAQNQSLAETQSLLSKIAAKRKQAQEVKLLPKLPSYLAVKASLQKIKTVNNLILRVAKLKARKDQIKFVEPPKLDSAQAIQKLLGLKLAASRVVKISQLRLHWNAVDTSIPQLSIKLQAAKEKLKEFDVYRCSKCGKFLSK